MKIMLPILGLFVFGLVFVTPVFAQDSPEESAGEVQGTTQEPSGAQPASGQEPVGEKGVKERAGEIVTDSREKVKGIAEEVDRSQQAQEASAGILRPIYQLAEYLSFPAFHWVAFCIMVTGVVSFALQLVLAKLVVLVKLSISLKAILSDVLGLVISLVGLVLTTQAAAENSNFTQSAAAVLSASIVGVLLGAIFYWWGQAQEIEAVRGRQAKV